MTRDWQQLRATFDQSAAFYDEIRPGYPDALYDDLVRLSALPDGGRLLEIGCGPGKATEPLARRGYAILCVEPGENLAAVARRKLAPFPRVEVRVCRFEDWELELEAFDLVFAATSFGWVDPAVRYEKTARTLRPGGCAAVFWNDHVQYPGQDAFWERVQDVYRRHAPQMVGRPRYVHELPSTVDRGFLDTGLMKEVAVRHYPWTETYDTERYVKLMLTFSDHIALPEPTRGLLIRDVAALIDEQFGGQIIKHHVAVLQLARRTR